ncbi:MAG: hypothetical protein IJN77_05175 [Oscillospiraceae bacterium]|nr:hypothetical protein [Oscillospiraceae bacterium]
MLYDIYMIILTSLAVFGLFGIVEWRVMSVRFSKASRSVTVLAADKSFSTYDTILYIHNTLYNNEIIVVSDGENTVFPMATTVSAEELHRYITNALFTKN